MNTMEGKKTMEERNDDLKFTVDDSNTINILEMKPQPAHTMTFSNDDGKEVASMCWETGELVFKGKADEAAKIFIKFLNNYGFKLEEK